MSTTGMIFDIQRFSLHDGPGIRTTVFLKGCPLRCAWCHNPESWSIKQELMYKEKEKKYTVCGKLISVDEILTEVNKDKAYYAPSGGGITVSGGEPMFQFDFCLSLLKNAKNLGIHTCVETSGMAPSENYSEIAKYTDLFLFDIKATNDKKHIAYTGASNKLILKNLERIYNMDMEILLRCPIIPEMNDTKDDIYGIAMLAEKYKDIKTIELLPYHDFGKSKWRELGKKYELDSIKMFEEDELKALIEEFHKVGCNKVTL